MKLILTILSIIIVGTNSYSQGNNTVIEDTIGKGLVPFVVTRGKASLKFYLPEKIKMRDTDTLTYVTGLKKNMKLYFDYFVEGKTKDEITMSGSGCSLSLVGNKSICLKFGEKLVDFTLMISAMKRNGGSVVAGKFRFKLTEN